MQDWILGYSKSVQGAGPPLKGEDFQRYEQEVPERPPADLRSLYSAFDGGHLNGGVELYPFEHVIDTRNTSEDSSWVFGARAGQRLLAARKATLAAHPGLQTRPSWFETTSADALVFAAHDPQKGALRVYQSLEQLLAVMVPPAQLEVFGDHTYARAMAAVESAISNVAGGAKKVAKKLAAAKPKLKAKAKLKPAAKKKTAKKPAKAARKAPAKNKKGAKKRR